MPQKQSQRQVAGKLIRTAPKKPPEAMAAKLGPFKGKSRSKYQEMEDARREIVLSHVMPVLVVVVAVVAVYILLLFRVFPA